MQRKTIKATTIETMEQKKMQMSQDDLYQYLTDHDVKLSRLAELMGKSLPVLSSAFLHHKNNAGYERNFSVENIALLNQSLPILSDELRQCLLTFGLVEHSVIHCKSCLPVLFIHKGQQSPKLRKKLLSVNTLHLR